MRLREVQAPNGVGVNLSLGPGENPVKKVAPSLDRCGAIPRSESAAFWI